MARTRDPGIDRSIHQATLAILAAKGLDGLTIDAVAARAGVARTTIYRRYSDIPSMASAAVDDLLALPKPAQGLEGLAAWREIVLSIRASLFESKLGLPLLAALIVAERDNPDLLELWRRRVVEPRIRMLSDTTGWPASHARKMGEFALGGLIARYLSTGAADEGEASDLADFIWERLAAR